MMPCDGQTPELIPLRKHDIEVLLYCIQQVKPREMRTEWAKDLARIGMRLEGVLAEMERGRNES